MTTRRLVIAPLLCLATLPCACTADPSPRPAVGEVPRAPGSAAVDTNAASAPSGVAPSESAAAAYAGSPFPPTGRYQVTSRVVSDDCRPKYAPPSPWSTYVQAGADRGRAKVNVALAAVPPSNTTSTTMRSDIVIEPRQPVKHTTTPVPACPSYTTTSTMSVSAASASGFTVAITVEYGDAVGCSSLPPSKCTTKVEHDYRVVRATCPAECTRGLASRPSDGGIAAADPEVDCRCP